MIHGSPEMAPLATDSNVSFINVPVQTSPAAVILCTHGEFGPNIWTQLNTSARQATSRHAKTMSSERITAHENPALNFMGGISIDRRRSITQQSRRSCGKVTSDVNVRSKQVDAIYNVSALAGSPQVYRRHLTDLTFEVQYGE